MTILQLAAVPLLVLLNGFFVAAEFALVEIRYPTRNPRVQRPLKMNSIRKNPSSDKQQEIFGN